MSRFRVSPEAEADLDDVWIYIARSSGSIDTASRVIDRITEQFWLLASHPYLGRSRDHDLRPGLRSLLAGEYLIVHRILEDNTVLILRVVHGRRDLFEVLGH